MYSAMADMEKIYGKKAFGMGEKKKRMYSQLCMILCEGSLRSNTNSFQKVVGVTPDFDTWKPLINRKMFAEYRHLTYQYDNEHTLQALWKKLQCKGEHQRRSPGRKDETAYTTETSSRDRGNRQIHNNNHATQEQRSGEQLPENDVVHDFETGDVLIDDGPIGEAATTPQKRCYWQ